jgi:hypothetical protein
MVLLIMKMILEMGTLLRVMVRTIDDDDDDDDVMLVMMHHNNG